MNVLKKTASLIVTVLLAAILGVFSFGCTSGGGETSDTGSSGKEELDMSKFPNYVDPDAAAYKFEEEQWTAPYWKGNVIYNESVMLIDNGTEISGKLQYPAIKVLSVRDYSYATEYENGVDYTVEGNVIKRLEGSSMPYLTEENLKGNDIPAPYRKVASISNVETDYVMMGTNVIYTEGSLVYGHQVAVSYVYDVKELNEEVLPTYETSGTPKLKAKLAAGEDVKIVITGDSVAEGCSSSSKFNRPPYMPNFIDMAVSGLKTAYPEANITLSNQAKGGMTSAWGADAIQVNKIIETAPDVVYIHFGINDLGSGAGPGTYADNMQSMVLTIKEALPECEFVLIKAFPANEWAYDYEGFNKYWARLDNIAKTENVYTLDMFSIGTDMLKVKKYMDVTGNGINHLNDFSARLYSMAILASLTK